MSTNRDKAAFPLTTDNTPAERGLTKHEWMATQIYAALLTPGEPTRIMPTYGKEIEIAEHAVKRADYLLSELEKPTQS